jgi:hypothetical protein
MKAAFSLCAHFLAVALGLTLTPRLLAVAPPQIDRARVAALLAQLDDDDYDRRLEADQALRRGTRLILPLLHNELARTSSLEVRKRVEGIIRELTADEHVPELVRLLAERQPDIREQADWELRRFGKVIVPLLRKELETASDEGLRRHLAQLIDDLGATR